MGQTGLATAKPRVDSLLELPSRFEKTLSSELAVSFAKRPPRLANQAHPRDFPYPYCRHFVQSVKKRGIPRSG
jgi:hypothetical protein